MPNNSTRSINFLARIVTQHDQSFRSESDGEDPEIDAEDEENEDNDNILNYSMQCVHICRRSIRIEVLLIYQRLVFYKKNISAKVL